MIRIDGLIDAHVHLAMPDVPIGVPVEDLRSLGIAGAVEGGSYGALDYAAAAEHWRGQMPVFVYANVSPRGLRGPRGTWGPPADDPRAVFAATGTRPDGIKLRLGQHPERNDLDDARNARAVAAELGVRLMVHVTGATCDPDDLLALLRPGDVLTHCFCQPPFSLLDGAGKVRRRALEARDRGVMFDLARGAIGHFDPKVAAAAIDQGFAPDFISTDWAIQRDGSQGPNLIETMQEMLGLGMDVGKIIAAVTDAPMRFYGFAQTGAFTVRLSDDLELLGVEP